MDPVKALKAASPINTQTMNYTEVPTDSVPLPAFQEWNAESGDRHKHTDSFFKLLFKIPLKRETRANSSPSRREAKQLLPVTGEFPLLSQWWFHCHSQPLVTGVLVPPLLSQWSLHRHSQFRAGPGAEPARCKPRLPNATAATGRGSTAIPRTAIGRTSRQFTPARPRLLTAAFSIRAAERGTAQRSLTIWLAKWKRRSG